MLLIHGSTRSKALTEIILLTYDGLVHGMEASSSRAVHVRAPGTGSCARSDQEMVSRDGIAISSKVTVGTAHLHNDYRIISGDQLRCGLLLY